MRLAEDYSTGKLTTACGNQCDQQAVFQIDQRASCKTTPIVLQSHQRLTLHLQNGCWHVGGETAFGDLSAIALVVAGGVIYRAAIFRRR
jgi:hypothetical protein